MFEDEYGNNVLYKWLLYAAAVCFLLAGVWWLVDRLDAASIERRMVNDTTLVNNMFGRVKAARSELNKTKPNFADHWSTGFDEQLTTAEKYFGPNGDSFQDLALAKEALAKADRATAKKYADQVELKLGEATGVVDQILGPPDHPEQALYLRLVQEGSQADAEILQAQNCIPVSEVQLVLFISSPNYGIGLAELENAKQLLSQAVTANSVPVENGIIDKPLAYELAASAYNSCLRAPQVASPPPPTSEPSPIIIIDNSGSGNDPSGYDSSGSDPFGYGSDPFDSGGGSDPFDSGGGSDGGGWDSGGGSDGGGWDSGGGSDGGGWDSGW